MAPSEKWLFRARKWEAGSYRWPDKADKSIHQHLAGAAKTLAICRLRLIYKPYIAEIEINR
jgi:hypothetical protein